MATKQLTGSIAPDGSSYICLTDGNGTIKAGGTKLFGNTAKDRADYCTLTNGNGTLV